jgi:hypothetical protein
MATPCHTPMIKGRSQSLRIFLLMRNKNREGSLLAISFLARIPYPYLLARKDEEESPTIRQTIIINNITN